MMLPIPLHRPVRPILRLWTVESKEGDLEQADPSGDGRSTKSSSAPHFITPGGTAAVWGTFAYTISPSAYRTLINRLQNDVGSLMWKGKRMRAYKAKPIDKLVPRHVMAELGPTSVHVSNKVAFVRCPMLGSLLHQHWEAGFCSSTELQIICRAVEKALIRSHLQTQSMVLMFGIIFG